MVTMGSGDGYDSGDDNADDGSGDGTSNLEHVGRNV
jgi:hypothetical protein